MDISNRNDRCTLVLLRGVQDQSREQKRRIRELETRYPDNSVYTDMLEKELAATGFMERVDLAPHLPYEDENGFPVARTYSPYITTQKGLEAIENGVFPSEMRKERKEANRWILDGWVQRITLIGGICGLISFVWLMIKQFAH